MESAARTTFRVILFMIAITVMTACVSTRTGQFGPIDDNDTNKKLVTLVVSSDRSVVKKECGDVLSLGPVYGCTVISPRSTLPNGRVVRTVKIVRWANQVPSDVAFEIDVHELCHVAASLQQISDPCHLNGGAILRARLR